MSYQTGNCDAPQETRNNGGRKGKKALPFVVMVKRRATAVTMFNWWKDWTEYGAAKTHIEAERLAEKIQRGWPASIETIVRLREEA